MSWRLWIDGARPGYRNMAIDQSLLERAERQRERWLRLYTWDPPCLSFGRHEPAARRYDQGQIRRLGLDTVRRPTGGRAVWHARELTYAVAAPAAQFGTLRQAYLEIHRMLLDALASLDVRAELAADAQASRPDAGACFARSAGGEVLAAARKVIGSAQLRQGSALLQHGSILLWDDQWIVEQVTRGADPSGYPGMTGDRLLPASIDRSTLIEAVARTAERRWRGHWQRSDGAEARARAAYHAERFRAAVWTWGPAGSTLPASPATLR